MNPLKSMLACFQIRKNEPPVKKIPPCYFQQLTGELLQEICHHLDSSSMHQWEQTDQRTAAHVSFYRDLLLRPESHRPEGIFSRRLVANSQDPLNHKDILANFLHLSGYTREEISLVLKKYAKDPFFPKKKEEEGEVLKKNSILKVCCKFQSKSLDERIKRFYWKIDAALKFIIAFVWDRRGTLPEQEIHELCHFLIKESYLESLFYLLNRSESRIAKILLAKRFDIDPYFPQETLLHSIIRGDTPQIKTFLDRLWHSPTLTSFKPNLNPKDSYGSTPLHYAVRTREVPGLVTWLLQRGANHLILDEEGDDVWKLAVERRDKFTQMILQELNAAALVPSSFAIRS